MASKQVGIWEETNQDVESIQDALIKGGTPKQATSKAFIIHEAVRKLKLEMKIDSGEEK